MKLKCYFVNIGIGTLSEHFNKIAFVVGRSLFGIQSLVRFGVPLALQTSHHIHISKPRPS